MFNAGVTVSLKSGGPAMTVVQTDAEKKVICMWFDASLRVQTATFLAPMLRREAVTTQKPALRRAA